MSFRADFGERSANYIDETTEAVPTGRGRTEPIN